MAPLLSFEDKAPLFRVIMRIVLSLFFSVSSMHKEEIWIDIHDNEDVHSVTMPQATSGHLQKI